MIAEQNVSVDSAMSTPPSSPPSRLLDSWAPKRRQSFRPCNFKERKGSIPQEVFLCGCMCVHACTLSLIQLFVTPWTGAHQAPLSMEFSRQEYWSGVPCPPPGDLPDSGIETLSSCVSSVASESLTTSPPGKPWRFSCSSLIQIHDFIGTSIWEDIISIVQRSEGGSRVCPGEVRDCDAFYIDPLLWASSHSSDSH